MKTQTFAPDLKPGQKVKILFKKPPEPWLKETYEITSINSTRTKALLEGLWTEFEPQDLVILRGELKEFTK